MIHDLVTKIKLEEKEPHIVIAGDTNHLDLSESLADFLDVRRLNTPATRNGAFLDEIYTNLWEGVVDCKAQPPLQNEIGGASDHLTLLTEIMVPKGHPFDWITYYARDMRKEDKKKFIEEYCKIDWENLIGNTDCPDQMTKIFHSVIDGLNERFFPLRKRKIKSTDAPWITEEIKRVIRRRRRRFVKHRRGPQWRAVKEETERLIKESKQKYYTEAIEKLKGEGSGQLPYAILRELAIPDRPAPWSVNQLAPGQSDELLAEDLADYFVRITDEFTPIGGYCPATYQAPFPLMEPHQVSALIKAGKKPKSAVCGDLLPSLVNECADLTAVPATRIINFCLQTGQWPSPWRMETQSAIPKKEGAATFDQLRNLSCTNGLSKVMESVVLERLIKEVSVRRNQYGGIRGSSTNHFLVNMLDRILTYLEDPSNVVALMSVDFSKAFNRVDHRACLDALAEGGASTNSLAMVAAFLRKRRMRFKVNNVLSGERLVRGGSPQGTKLGNFLFIITIDRIEQGSSRPMTSPISDSESDDSSDPGDTYGLRTLAGRIGAVRGFDGGVEHSSTPQKTQTMNSVLRYDDVSGRDLSDLGQTIPPTSSRPIDTWHDKYVDDVNVGEAVPTGGAVIHLSEQRQLRTIKANGCQDSFEVINRNATSLGMKVNPKKTQLLCVSGSNFCQTDCYIEADGDRIDSQESMMLLGFCFGNRPNMDEHVALIHRKFYARSWLPRHLKAAGIPEKDICKVYSSVIRSSIEYAIPAYHSLLTTTQSDRLERLQRRSLKSIFGLHVSYEDALKRSGLPRLDDRRCEIFKKFAVKAGGNDRFKDWFPLNSPSKYNLRKEKTFKEFHAKTERLRKSPLYEMRRLLNSI